MWRIGGIVLWPLLLWPLLVLLRASFQGSWFELVLVLPKCVVESSRVGDSLPGSDEFDHLSSLGDIDHSGFVFVIVL
jgi:hypothetical protein